MTIIEAIKSGKPVKRGDASWFSFTKEPYFTLSKESILATDWEVKLDKVKKKEVYEALNASSGLTGFDLDSKEYQMKYKYKDLLQRILDNGVEE